MAGGSFAWGILGDHLGRRRALISALSVAVLFSAVASVMPTYGTFMMARQYQIYQNKLFFYVELILSGFVRVWEYLVLFQYASVI